MGQIAVQAKVKVMYYLCAFYVASQSLSQQPPHHSKGFYCHANKP